MRLVRVVAPHFVAGYESDGTVQRATPILRWCVGRADFEVWNYFDKKGWEYEIVA